MNLIFLIAACLGAWIFALIISNQRKTQFQEMEAKIAQNTPPDESAR